MDTNHNRVSLVLGALFVLAGLLLLIVQWLGFTGWGNFWPLIVVLIGAGFFLGMVMGGKEAGGLAIPGSIIVTVGAILFVQNALNWWETWAYAWTLIIAAVGAGVWIDGAWSGQSDLQQGGWRTMRAGIILFLIFGILFEFIFSFSGVSNHASGLFWAVMLALLGLVALVIQLLRLARGDRPEGETIGLFWPIALFGAGCLGVLASQGWLTSDNVSRMISLWPIVLVALGLYLILGRRYAWIGAAIAVLLIASFLVVGMTGDRLGIQPVAPLHLGDGLNFTGFQISLVNEQVTGSGPVTEETRPVSGIERIRVNSQMDFEITQGNSESLVISAESNLLPYILTTMRGNQLVIDTKNGVNLNAHQPIKGRLVVKDLSAFQVSGSAHVTIDSLTTDDLSITVPGSADFDLKNLQASGKLTFDAGGTGNLTASGQAGSQQVQFSGSGNYKAGDLKTGQANVRINGSGNVTVWVTDSLDIHIPGSGNVTYYGNPHVTQDIPGSGTVKSLGNK